MKVEEHPNAHQSTLSPLGLIGQPLLCRRGLRRESPFRFGRIEFALAEMETINRAAYWDFPLP
jgi:hypothetical protein